MQKVSITSDARLWAELANCRHENFCSPILRVASVESTRIYEKLVAKKVKDTPRFKNRLDKHWKMHHIVFNYRADFAETEGLA